MALAAVGFQARADKAETMVQTLPVRISDVKVEHSETSLISDLVVDGSDLKLKSNEELLVEPELDFGDGHTVRLTPVIFLGHNRKVQAERNPAKFKGMILAEAGRQVPVSAIVPYESWMQTGSARAAVTRRGCCAREYSEGILTGDGFRFAEPWKFAPQFRFITPKAEGSKIRNLSGKAYIDFRVNRTEIDPVYRKNPHELAMIYATIDSVRDDADVEIKSMTFTGYASPEGSYSNNERLARERAAALSAYVKTLYAFPDAVVKSSYVPEDWAGLEAAVAQSAYPDREGMLAIIRDTRIEPDARERKFATRYPAEYRELLRDVYPGLRHSDYTIEYTVKSYDDPVKILELLETAPRKLSLREMFVAANTLEPGSDRYCRVFETAARMYPESEVANLNAAISELQGGRTDRAAQFLDRAGNSPEAIYTRGLLAAFNENYTEARTLLTEANKLGIAEAAEALSQLDRAGK